MMKTYGNFGDKVIRPIYFLNVALKSGPFLANSSDRNITLDGLLYYGIGSLGQIQPYQTTNGTEASMLKFSLSGIPAELASVVLYENTRNRPVTAYLGLADDANQLLYPPFIWFRGTIDSMAVQLDKSIIISGSASSKLINWAHAVNTRYTDEEQQALFPGDRGFRFIADMTTLKLAWGS